MLLCVTVVVGEQGLNCTVLDTVLYRSVECGGNCHACLLGGTEVSPDKRQS